MVKQGARYDAPFDLGQLLIELEVDTDEPLAVIVVLTLFVIPVFESEACVCETDALKFVS